jgi:hypothetical protein
MPEFGVATSQYECLDQAPGFAAPRVTDLEPFVAIAPATRAAD